MTRRARRISGLLGLAAMTLSSAEGVLASTCAAAPAMASMEMGTASAADPGMASMDMGSTPPAEQAALAAGADRMGPDAPGMDCCGDRSGCRHHDADGPCPLTPMTQGCMAAASLPAPHPHLLAAASAAAEDAFFDPAGVDLLRASAPFHPPR